MPCDAQTLVTLAATNKAAGLSRRGLGEAIAAQAAQHTTGAAPAAPAAIAATNNAGIQFSANWNASAGATSYRLDLSTDPLFGSFVAGFNNLNVGNVVTLATASIGPLVPNTTYYYRVRAVSGGGTSASSNTISLLTFSPIQLAPFAWYDASDNDTVLNVADAPCGNGEDIYTWADKSVNGRNLDTPFGDPPVYSVAAINGRNGAVFDGMTSCIGAGVSVGPAFPFSLFAVAMMPAMTGSPSGLVGFQSAMFYADEPGNPGSLTWYGGGASHTQSTGGLLGVGVPFAIGITDDGVATPVLYNEGVAVGYTPPTDTGGDAPSAGTIVLGARAGDSSFPFPGTICEVVVVSSIMSAGNRASLQAYFAAKWGA